jgi:hypothetical protein
MKGKKKKQVKFFPISSEMVAIPDPFVLVEEADKHNRKVDVSTWLIEHEEELNENSPFVPTMYLVNEIKTWQKSPEKKTKGKRKTPDTMADDKQGGCHETLGLGCGSEKEKSQGKKGLLD